MTPLSHNKRCEFEDFADAEVAGLIREVFDPDGRRGPGYPRGREYRKEWEIAMALRALRHFGALRPDSLILGVGAGTEATIFHLTRLVKLVFATDLYVQQTEWSPHAPARMLWDAEAFAPYPYDRQRLVVQHMDGRFLDYPDDFFDGIFSSGSIEHFGGLEDAALCAFEMGRVLKPGGILTLSTELCVAGPAPSLHAPGLSLFSADELRRYVVEASGLEPVEDLATTLTRPLSERTRASVRPLADCIVELEAAIRAQGPAPRAAEVTWSVYPHLLLELQGHTFGSVHLALRKSSHHPVVDNAWARPTPEIVRTKRWRPVAAPRPGIVARVGAAARRITGLVTDPLRRATTSQRRHRRA